MLHVVTTGAYYPPIVTALNILATGASYLTTGTLCTVSLLAKEFPDNLENVQILYKISR